VLGQQMGFGASQGPLSYEQWLAQNTPAAAGGGKGGSGTMDAIVKGGKASLGSVATGIDPISFGVVSGLFGGHKKKPKPGAVAAQAASADTANRAAYDAYTREFADTHAQNPGVDGDLMRDFTLADFEKDPGYEFRRSEGEKAVEASAAARGILASGGTLKGLDRYNQDYASGEFSNAYNRFNNDRTTRFNRLSTLAGLGQTAATNVANFGANTANNVADLTTQRGNAAAAGQIARGNAINDGVQTLSDFYQQAQYNRRKPGYNSGGYGGGYYGGQATVAGG
jgi:hypothetical protein